MTSRDYLWIDCLRTLLAWSVANKCLGTADACRELLRREGVK